MSVYASTNPRFSQRVSITSNYGYDQELLTTEVVDKNGYCDHFYDFENELHNMNQLFSTQVCIDSESDRYKHGFFKKDKIDTKLRLKLATVCKRLENYEQACEQYYILLTYCQKTDFDTQLQLANLLHYKMNLFEFAKKYYLECVSTLYVNAHAFYRAKRSRVDSVYYFSGVQKKSELSMDIGYQDMSQALSNAAELIAKMWQIANKEGLKEKANSLRVELDQLISNAVCFGNVNVSMC